MDQKLILIDGSSVLSSCFYGTVPKDYYKDREQSLSKLLKTLTVSSPTESTP